MVERALELADGGQRLAACPAGGTPRRSPPRRRSAAASAPRRRTSAPWPCCRSPARDRPRRRAARSCAAGRATLRPARPHRRARRPRRRHRLGRHVVGGRGLRGGRRRGDGRRRTAGGRGWRRWRRRAVGGAALGGVGATAAGGGDGRRGRRSAAPWRGLDGRCCGSRSRTRRATRPAARMPRPTCARCSAAAARCSCCRRCPSREPRRDVRVEPRHPAALRAAARRRPLVQHVVVLEVGRRVTARARRADPLRRLGLGRSRHPRRRGAVGLIHQIEERRAARPCRPGGAGWRSAASRDRSGRRDARRSISAASSDRGTGASCLPRW